MRKIMLIVVLSMIVTTPVAADENGATEDYTIVEGTRTLCVEPDGSPGFVTLGQCVTEADYAVMFSVENLVATGVLTAAVDRGDGTVTVTHALGGTDQVIVADATARPLGVNVVPPEEIGPFGRWLGRAFARYAPTIL